VDLLDWAGDRGDGGGDVPQARAARGGRQGALLLQEHQRHGVSQRRGKLFKLAACSPLYYPPTDFSAQSFVVVLFN